MLTLALLASLGGGAPGCAHTPEEREAARLEALGPRPVAEAFRDCLRTYYAVASGRPEDRALLAARAEAGGRLVGLLEERGVRVRPGDAALGLRGLVPVVERYLHTRTDDATIAVVAPGDPDDVAAGKAERADPGSIAIGFGVEREAGLEVALVGRSARYAVVTWAEEVCSPLDVERARSAAQAPRLWVVGETIYANRARFPERPAPGDVSLDEAIALAAASLLFRDPATAASPSEGLAGVARPAMAPERRDAKVLLALLDGEHAALALRLAASLATAPAGRLVLAEARRAGLGLNERGTPLEDRALASKIGALSSVQARRLLDSAREKGGLLDTTGSP